MKITNRTAFEFTGPAINDWFRAGFGMTKTSESKGAK